MLAEALSHLYVLLPVLDSSKHYWVSADEVDKLVRAGGAWLPTRHEDVARIAKDTEHFSSQGIIITDWRPSIACRHFDTKTRTCSPAP